MDKIDLLYDNVDDKKNDWHGNNAAFTCLNTACGKVFIVSRLIDNGKRNCPGCGKFTGHCTNGKGGEAWIESKEDR